MPQTATTTDTRTTGERPRMTDRPKNLSFLTPTSVMNPLESTPHFTRILTPLFSTHPPATRC
jgi:hypothetical protein